MSGSPSGFAALGDAWGKCEISYIQSENTNTNTNKNEISSSNWILVRSSSSTDIFINNSENAILIKSANRMYSKIHKRHQNNKDTDVRFGILWKDKKIEGGSKMYMYDIQKPTKVVSSTQGFTKVFYLEFDDAASILKNDKKYMYFLMTDYEKYTWYATRTISK
tara:strand:- start:483 stop:974 length:492 start_codon:yes stop_codon:yes gene_type:complete